MYDLIDENLKKWYINTFSYMFLVFIFISLIFIFLAIFYLKALIFLAIIFAIISLIFFIFWNKNKKMYGNKLSYNNNTITIYSYKNLKIKEFKIANLKSSYIKIAFSEYPKRNFRSCLIIYTDFEPFENMEYSSYWNESDIAILQNPQLIEIINKILK